MKVFAVLSLLCLGLLTGCGSGGDSEDANIVASVFAGEDQQVVEKTDFNIVAQGSPAGGTFTWQQVSGPAVEGFPLEGGEQIITAPDVKADSQLVLRVSYQTPAGSLVTDDISISIASNNLLPQAVVSQIAPTTLPSAYSDIITLSALDSIDPDANGDIVSYSWSLISGPNLEVDSYTSSTLSFPHPLLESNSNLKWLLMVTDDEGGESSAEYMMTLNKTEQIVIADAGEDQLVSEFDEVTLDASSSEVTTATYKCNWQQLSGNAETLTNSSQCTTRFFASDVDTITELNFEVTVTDSKGRSNTDTVFVDVTQKPLGLINDTGMGECYNNTQRINCGSDDFLLQDAELGRDSFANRLDKVGEGNLAFDFTKLNEFADEVSDDSSQFSCVRDNVTGLVWEVKSPLSGVVPNTTLRDGQNHYIWDLGNASSVGSSSGGANTTCPSNTDCGLQTYIDEVNSTDFCGGTNWRVPTYSELLGLIDYGKQGQAILLDENLFPNMADKTALGHLRFWTSQTAVDGTSLSQAYIIDMSDGNDLAYPKEDTAYVRLVRSR